MPFLSWVVHYQLTHSSCLLLQSLCFQHCSSSIRPCCYCKGIGLTILLLIWSKIKKRACMRIQGQLSLWGFFSVINITNFKKIRAWSCNYFVCKKKKKNQHQIELVQQSEVLQNQISSKMYNTASISFFTMLHCQSKWSRVMYTEKKKINQFHFLFPHINK